MEWSHFKTSKRREEPRRTALCADSNKENSNKKLIGNEEGFSLWRDHFDMTSQFQQIRGKLAEMKGTLSTMNEPGALKESYDALKVG